MLEGLVGLVLRSSKFEFDFEREPNEKSFFNPPLEPVERTLFAEDDGDKSATSGDVGIVDDFMLGLLRTDDDDDERLAWPKMDLGSSARTSSPRLKAGLAGDGRAWASFSWACDSLSEVTFCMASASAKGSLFLRFDTEADVDVDEDEDERS